MQNYEPSLPKSVQLTKKVSKDEYKELIQFAYIEHRESIDCGQTNQEPSIERKKNLIELLNCLGLYFSKYERLLGLKLKKVGSKSVFNNVEAQNGT